MTRQFDLKDLRKESASLKNQPLSESIVSPSRRTFSNHLQVTVVERRAKVMDYFSIEQQKRCPSSL
jgi:hypothetical protein